MSRLLLSFFVFALFVSGYGQALPDAAFNSLIRTENGGWIAGDATYSIALPDGRTLWLFGDSFIGIANPDSSIVSGAHMIRNCAVVQDGEEMTAMYQGTFENPIDFVRTNDSETWFWPEHGMVEGNTLKILLSEFGPNGDTTGWNFEFRQTYVAVFTYPDIELIETILLPYYDLNGVMYGDQLMLHDGYTYIYGRKEESGNIPYMHVARVPEDDLLGEWEFYNRSVWSENAEESFRLTSQTVSQQFGLFEHKGKWVMITQEIWLGAKIYSMVADAPEGPWSNRVTVYETPRPFATQITYNAYPHPQFDEDNELLVSYNSNGSFWDIFTNVELYRPNFVRVPYLMIDSSFTPTDIPKYEISTSGLVVITNCYPSPATEQVTITFSSPVSLTIKPAFYDLSGKEIAVFPEKKYSVGEHQLTISLSGFPKGVIIVRLGDQCTRFVHN